MTARESITITHATRSADGGFRSAAAVWRVTTVVSDTYASVAHHGPARSISRAQNGRYDFHIIVSATHPARRPIRCALSPRAFSHVASRWPRLNRDLPFAGRSSFTKPYFEFIGDRVSRRPTRAYGCLSSALQVSVNDPCFLNHTCVRTSTTATSRRVFRVFTRAIFSRAPRKRCLYDLQLLLPGNAP